MNSPQYVYVSHLYFEGTLKTRRKEAAEWTKNAAEDAQWQGVNHEGVEHEGFLEAKLKE